MKPNIFKLATKELSQDSFFAWLLQWADKRQNTINQELSETARDFIKLLIKDQNYDIIKVEAGRQWRDIDIWAKINEEYFIAIEDKIDSVAHSNQLERYKQIATEHYKGKEFKLVFIYLKTGNESSATLKKVIEDGYLVVDRRAILNILNKRHIANDIFSDFKAYLTTIENLTNSYNSFESIMTEWKAAEGFYLQLQELIPEWTDWRYVPNQMGGFLGFWYHWRNANDHNLYIQIENAFEKGIKLVVKIDEWEPNTSTLYRILNELKPLAQKNGLNILKPDKYRAGATSTLGVVQNAFPVCANGDLDIVKFTQTLKSLEQALDEYSMAKGNLTISELN